MDCRVSLRGHEDVYIPSWGARIDTLWIAGERACIQIRVQVRNDRPQPCDMDLDLDLTAPDGSAKRHHLGKLRLAPATSEWFNSWLWLDKAQPWAPDSPRFYRARFSLREAGDKEVGEYGTRFGLRTVMINADQGLLVNGHSVKLRGANLHHDNGLLGARAFRDAERRRVRLMKENGYNAIRTAHNPPSIAFLDACDEEGILVIDEFTDTWQLPKKPNGYQRYFDHHAEQDLGTMISRDFNHPSIVMWSIGNEIPERFTPAGAVIGRRLAEIVHREDPRRFVTSSVNLLWEDPSIGDRWEVNDTAFSYLDVGGYDYRWKKYETDHVRHPQRVMYGAESYPNEAWENWRAVEQQPYVIGDFVWSAMDYLGESGIGHTGYVENNFVLSEDQDSTHLPWPVWNSWCGDLDVTGDKKPQSLYRDVVWRRSAVEVLVHEPIPAGKKEKVGSWGWPAELPSWNWSGREGQPLQVTVYTRGSRVRLSLNDQIIGEQDVDQGRGITAHFSVPWASGRLVATAFDGGKEMGAKELRTTGKVAALRLQPETKEGNVDRGALLFVRILAVDAGGAVVPDTTLALTLAIAGEAELCGFGSGDPGAIGPLADGSASTFRGRALAILRPTGKAGEVRLTLTAAGLPAASVSIPIRSVSGTEP